MAPLVPVEAVDRHAHPAFEGNRQPSAGQARDPLAVHQVGPRGEVSGGIGQRAGRAEPDAGDRAAVAHDLHAEDRPAVRDDHGAAPVTIHLDRREPAETGLSGDRDGDIGQQLQAAGMGGRGRKGGDYGREADESTTKFHV